MGNLTGNSIPYWREYFYFIDWIGKIKRVVVTSSGAWHLPWGGGRWRLGGSGHGRSVVAEIVWGEAVCLPRSGRSRPNPRIFSAIIEKLVQVLKNFTYFGFLCGVEIMRCVWWGCTKWQVVYFGVSESESRASWNKLIILRYRVEIFEG